jgi:hypothetical protein
MSFTVNGSFKSGCDLRWEGEYGIDDSKVENLLNAVKASALTLDECDKLFHADGTIADAANVSFDLLTILGPDGVAINLAEMRGLLIVNTTTPGATAANLIFSGGAANPWTGCFGDPSDTLIIPPGTGVSIPIPVASRTVDGTHKTIKLTHDGTGAADATYQIALAGVEA